MLGWDLDIRVLATLGQHATRPLAAAAAVLHSAQRVARGTKATCHSQHAHSLNRDLCHSLGVGPAPIPLAHLNESTLAAGLKTLATGAAPGCAFAAAAAAVAERLQGEDGVGAAAASVLRSVRR